MKSIRSNEDLRQAALYTVIFLFFFQLVADFVEAIYAFGLLGTGIPNEIVSVALFWEWLKTGPNLIKSQDD